MSGRRRGRPPKVSDELTQREADTLARVEAEPDGITSSEIAAMFGVKRASTDTWLNELRRRGLVHSFPPEGANTRTPHVWMAGPAYTGPLTSPLMARALPSIFHAGVTCT